MSGQSWKDMSENGDLEARAAEYAAASGAPGSPRIPIDLDDTTGPAFERPPAPLLILPGIRPAGSRVSALEGRRAEPSEALALLALGASGLIDWRRKREASPRA